MPELTPIQSQVLAGLLAGGSIAAVAREHKIHRSTIYNWQHDHPAFIYALKDARARHRAIMYDAAQDLAARAYETLATLLASDNEQTRLRAAQAILRNTSASATAPAAEAVEQHLSAGGASRAKNATERRDVLRCIAPGDRALLASTLPLSPDPAAADSAPRLFDTIRQNSTLLAPLQSVEPPPPPPPATRAATAA